MSETKTCPKCNSGMKESSVPMGLVLVRNRGTELAPEWVIATEFSGAVMYPHLCGECGFIELYAPVKTFPSSIGPSHGRGN
jgi:hypothetical protein